MFDGVKDYLLDLRIIFIVIMIIVGIALLSFVPVLFGVIFGAMAWLGLSLASKYLNKFLAGTAINVSKLTEAKKYTIVKLPEKFDVRFVEPRGFKNVLWNIFLFNLLGSFMVVRYFGIPSTNLDAFIGGYLLAVLIASIIALIVTPIAVNVSAIETTRFRVVDLDKMLMTYPAYLFYRLIKAIFGFGNLAVIIVIFANAMAVAGGDIFVAVGLFIAVLVTTISSVAFGSLLAVLISRLVRVEVVEDLMNTYDEALEPMSISSEDFLNQLRELIGERKEEIEERVEEEVKEEEEIEEVEEKTEELREEESSE